MKHRISTTSNGIRVVTTEIADAFSVTALVSIGTGSRYETAGQSGVSHFLEHLLFKGTKKRPTPKIISEEIDAVGGWNNAYTTNDLTSFYVKVPHQHTDLAIDILADMMGNSTLKVAEIERERGVVLEEMNVYQDDPARFVNTLTPPLLWPKHPLAADIIGTPDVIQTIGRDAISDYWEKYYVSENVVVSVAGRLKHDDIVAKVEKQFAGFRPGGSPTFEPVDGEMAERKVNVFAKPTAQTHLIIATRAFPYRHAKDPAVKLIRAILGAGLSSRLFTRIREEKGLAYSINAGVQNFVDTGQFEIYAGLNLAKTNEAITAILEELDLLINKPVPDAELKKAKEQIRGGLQMGLESNTAVADRLATQVALLGEFEPTEVTLAKIDAVTIKEIQDVATELLDRKRLRMGIIAPAPDEAAEHFEELTR
jgi:predicted Zn-dependent peptidase